MAGRLGSLPRIPMRRRPSESDEKSDYAMSAAHWAYKYEDLVI